MVAMIPVLRTNEHGVRALFPREKTFRAFKTVFGGHAVFFPRNPPVGRGEIGNRKKFRIPVFPDKIRKHLPSAAESQYRHFLFIHFFFPYSC